MILERLFSHDFRRRRLLARAPAGPLRDYLAQPFPAPETAAADAAYLALDLETTGGDPDRDEIVSFGWVCIDDGAVDLGSARHRVVRLRGAMGGVSATIHRITDDEAAAGGELGEALAELLRALAGRVLIAHRAQTELDFVGRACARIFGGRILIPAIDTLQMAIDDLRRRERQQGQNGENGHNEPPQRGALRLPALRRQYGLPRYRIHNALSDALAAAELYLAQLASRPGRPTLKSLRYRN